MINTLISISGAGTYANYAADSEIEDVFDMCDRLNAEMIAETKEQIGEDANGWDGEGQEVHIHTPAAPLFAGEERWRGADFVRRQQEWADGLIERAIENGIAHGEIIDSGSEG